MRADQRRRAVFMNEISGEREKRDHGNYGDLHDGKQMSDKDNDLLADWLNEEEGKATAFETLNWVAMVYIPC